MRTTYHELVEIERICSICFLGEKNLGGGRVVTKLYKKTTGVPQIKKERRMSWSGVKKLGQGKNILRPVSHT